jgi:hypothetical protein
MSFINYLSVLNVKYYGAVGNGVADDTAAIQTALDAVPAYDPTGDVPSGAIVYFPEGNYLISKPLVRQQPFTACIGAGKDATQITLNQASWDPVPSPADPSRSYILDQSSLDNTDCLVSDMTIDGDATHGPTGMASANQCGILVLQRDIISRVNLYDIWGYCLWIFGASAEWSKVLDCEAWLGSNPNANSGYAKGSDCIGGGGMRTLIQRFHWNANMAKNTALDFIPGGGPGAEVSVDLIDCINESVKDIRFEGCVQSSVRGCRFYGNLLLIHTNAGSSSGASYVYNPLDILVEGNIFIGIHDPQDNDSGLEVAFDGGADAPEGVTTYPGGRVAVIGNTFIDCDNSAILWHGETDETSIGGSIISANRIYNPNQTGGPGGGSLVGAYGQPQGKWLGSGISILNTQGLTIQGNTVLDQSGDMLYSMQLFSATSLTYSGARILVQGNLCGSAPGVGNGSAGTFYYSASPTANNPSPILLNNTNQEQGLDSTPLGVVGNDVAWPGAGGYPYNAFICVNTMGATISFIDIGGEATGLLSGGTFYIPVGQTFTIKWTSVTIPTIKVFQS